MGKLDQTVVTHASQASALQEANIQYAKLLEELPLVDYAAYVQRQHKAANRAGPLLAKLIRDTPQNTPIMEITTLDGTVVSTQLEINDAFQDYYQALYDTPRVISPMEYDSFFEGVRLPQLLEEQKEELRKPSTVMEIKAAIKALPRSKAPGSDGLPVEFYKEYATQLAQRLKHLYQTALDAGSLPDTTLQAIRVPLPKPGKNNTELEGYRPLSLLNTDYNILGKILATRLAHLIPGLIHVDQCGFVAGRNTALNIRRLHQLMQHTTGRGGAQRCISLDLQQAFDSLHWNYMLFALSKYGITIDYINWVRLLYTNPTARARKGAYISKQ